MTGGGAGGGGAGQPPAPPGSSPGPPGEPPDAARLDRDFAEWARSLTDEERSAIRRYQREGGAINDYLRGIDCPLHPELEAHIDEVTDTLDAVIARGRVSEPVRVVHGLGTEALARLGGHGYTAASFSSASLNAALIADTYPVVLEFAVPPGTPAAWLALPGLPKYRHELELLLPRGVRFTFVSIRDEGGTVFIETEIS